jgi:hypothetical protein
MGLPVDYMRGFQILLDLVDLIDPQILQKKDIGSPRYSLKLGQKGG